MIFIILILFFIIYFSFYFLNKLFIKNKIEFFDRLSNGLVCGTEGNICGRNEIGVNSCCKGLKCIRPNGKYLNRICLNQNNNNFFDGIINIPDLNNVNEKINLNPILNDTSDFLNKGLEDIEGAFSGVGKFFSNLSNIPILDSCKK
jgi:hypothetical protein